MNVALIDVDGHNFPNLALMKLSAWHKAQGDNAGWYVAGRKYDRTYMSKVFTFTPDFDFGLFAPDCEVIKGGTGYFYPDGGKPLPDEVEHTMPDYALYGVNEAYGFLTRGCPRGCGFCIVGKKEGLKSRKVADLKEFWSGQNVIKLLDPNLLACAEREDLLAQLVASGASVDFTQGVDIRLMTEGLAQMFKQVRVERVHFAWDRWEDKDVIVPRLEMFKGITQWNYKKLGVYVLCNYGGDFAHDVERVETLKHMGFNPYVMLYEKEKLPRGSIYRKLQRYTNNRQIFRTAASFDEYVG